MPRVDGVARTRNAGARQLRIRRRHARHSWLGKQSSADLENEFRDAADETTSLLHRPPSRFRDAAQ